MIKPLLICAAVGALCACAPKSSPPPVGEPPAGMLKVLTDTKELTSWLDTRSVSTWQDNPRLRRVYMINNYSKRTLILEKPPVYISSSRAINVINCDKNERAVFERVYFSEPYAEGQVISITHEIGQWQPFPKESLMGIFAAAMCQIAPEKLKPQPPKETRKPLLD